MFKRFMKDVRARLVAARKKAEAGFTLMELLVVIVILGFLIAMIAPRLASIIDDKVIDAVCDTNNKGARQYIAIHHQQTGKLPNEVINLVNQTGAGAYAILGTSDNDPQNGAEPFAVELQERNALQLHVINAAEAAELRKLGIANVRNFNYVTESKDATLYPLAGTVKNPESAARTLERVNVAANLGVAMVGIGAANATAELADPTAVGAIGNPYWLGRIAFGLGEHSTLVTGGYVQNAALCPAGIQAADNVAYNNYAMIVPRLEATVARAATALAAREFTITEATADNHAVAKANGKVETFRFESQKDWDFDATCPEGHKWPDSDFDFWVVQ